MKKKQLLTAIACALASCSAFAGAENLLYNSSFEFAGSNEKSALGWGGR